MGSIILGAGATGLAAGSVLGWKIFEAEENPGGICSSYYRTSGSSSRRAARSADEEDYRFEIGGGHWMFGENAEVFRFIAKHARVRQYVRRSSVFLPSQHLLIPYPIQNHLSYLPNELADEALDQIQKGSDGSIITMADWFRRKFGTALCDLFFAPFHQSYTAGLWEEIVPQDPHKSPFDLTAVIRGRHGDTDPIGYNVRFSYPVDGLGTLFRSMAESCDISYGKRVVAIDPVRRVVSFSDDTQTGYDSMISTIPLNRMVDLARLRIPERADPYTSVLVLNVGGTRGRNSPPDHWLYVPESKSGFFRIGFYSNVEKSFLPRSRRQDGRSVSMYIEKAFRGGEKPDEHLIGQFCESAIEEMRMWGFIDDVDVADPTWIDVAYTWSACGSTWREKAISALQDVGIHQAGRYGRWRFQGIVESIAEGLNLHRAFRSGEPHPQRLTTTGPAT